MPFILQTSAAAAGNRFVKAHDMPTNVIRTLLPTMVQIGWTNVDATATEILIKRSVNGSPFRELATLLPTDTYYYDYAITNGRTYIYRIAAQSSSGRSRWAIVRPVTVPNPPEAIQNYVVSTVKTINTARLNFSWTKSAGQSSTLLQIATDPDYTEMFFESYRNTAAFTKLGIPQNTFYYTRVQAQSPYGPSPWVEQTILTAS